MGTESALNTTLKCSAPSPSSFSFLQSQFLPLLPLHFFVSISVSQSPFSREGLVLTVAMLQLPGAPSPSPCPRLPCFQAPRVSPWYSRYPLVPRHRAAPPALPPSSLSQHTSLIQACPFLTERVQSNFQRFGQTGRLVV